MARSVEAKKWDAFERIARKKAEKAGHPGEYVAGYLDGEITVARINDVDHPLVKMATEFPVWPVGFYSKP